MSLTLAGARAALADGLTGAIEDLHVRDRPGVRQPKAGDGWVVLGRLIPLDYTRAAVTLTAVIILGSDESNAEDLLDEWAVDILDAATTIEDLPAADVALESIVLVLDGGASLNAITLTLTTEVEPRT